MYAFVSFVFDFIINTFMYDESPCGCTSLSAPTVPLKIGQYKIKVSGFCHDDSIITTQFEQALFLIFSATAAPTILPILVLPVADTNGTLLS